MQSESLTAVRRQLGVARQLTAARGPRMMAVMPISMLFLLIPFYAACAGGVAFWFWLERVPAPRPAGRHRLDEAVQPYRPRSWDERQTTPRLADADTCVLELAA